MDEGNHFHFHFHLSSVEEMRRVLEPAIENDVNETVDQLDRTCWQIVCYMHDDGLIGRANVKNRQAILDDVTEKGGATGALARVKSLGLVESIGGRSGGHYLTPFGVLCAQEMLKRLTQGNGN